MKSWLKFFFLGYLSHKGAKDGARRGYLNTLLAFVLSLVFIYLGSLGAFMLPFGTQYSGAESLKGTVYALLASPDKDKRIELRIADGVLTAREHGGAYAEGLIVDTIKNKEDKNDYSVGGCEVVVDTRRADALAEIEAYCVSNDGRDMRISYDEYLSLSEVARLNFEFKLRYTGEELVLGEGNVRGFYDYLIGVGGECASRCRELDEGLGSGDISRDKYNRAIYELYFSEYYPSIEVYERASRVPLLRNYYQHEYLNSGVNEYLFIFNDCIAASFATRGGALRTFYGFYAGLADGELVGDMTGAEAEAAADNFIKECFRATLGVSAYAHLSSVISLVPYLALMLFVATLLAYSVLRIRGVETVSALGDMLKIVGSFLWQSGLISAILSTICSFFLGEGLMNMLPIVIFFVALIVRALIFAIREIKQNPRVTRVIETED